MLGGTLMREFSYLDLTFSEKVVIHVVRNFNERVQLF